MYITFVYIIMCIIVSSEANNMLGTHTADKIQGQNCAPEPMWLASGLLA